MNTLWITMDIISGHVVHDGESIWGSIRWRSLAQSCTLLQWYYWQHNIPQNSLVYSYMFRFVVIFGPHFTRRPTAMMSATSQSLQAWKLSVLATAENSRVSKCGLHVDTWLLTTYSIWSTYKYLCLLTKINIFNAHLYIYIYIDYSLLILCVVTLFASVLASKRLYTLALPSILYCIPVVLHMIFDGQIDSWTHLRH